MSNENNMICDLETGVCGTGEDKEVELIDFNKQKEEISLYYVTDPICSHCWALEPVLNKFIEQYGHYFNMHTVMGGLLESWDGFADVSNGISKASDVAGHWKEVGEHSRMPIDGSLWTNDPVHSSYPPSRVFKIIQSMDHSLANLFLRKIREAVFVFNKNIAKADVLITIVNELNLNGEKIVTEAASESAQSLLKQDFDLARKLGVRGFPTIIMINEENKGVKIVGARTFQEYVNGLKQVLSSAENINPKPQPPLSNLLDRGSLLFSKEIEVMYDIDEKDVTSFIEREAEYEKYELKEILGEKYFEKK
ncbi:DsbA family protein [Metabacillus fastidiosus]|uniref:DsbA family oxidoreductase n=1 Tax=Metabacillus fastidiosus TaxID=1458 RepID=UPI002E242C25|nr:DsbA family protein [Metabacillus fastidiosus]